MTETAELRARRAPTLRTQLLAVALVPSLLLLGGGLAVSGVLLADAAGARTRAEAMAAATAGITVLLPAVSEERRVSALIAQGERRAALDGARRAVDVITATLLPQLDALDRIGIDELTRDDGDIRTSIQGIGALRRSVDGGAANRLEVMEGYSETQDAALELVAAIGPRSSGEDAAGARVDAELLLRAADQLARGASLAVAAFPSGGLNDPEQTWFAQQLGVYDSELGQLDGSELDGDGPARLAELRSSPGFTSVETLEEAVTANRIGAPATTGPPVPLRTPTVDVAAYATAAGTIVSTLRDLGAGELTFGAQRDAEITASAFRSALLVGILLVAVGIGVLVLALGLSNRLVRRLTHLRAGTLRRAQEELPRMVERLRSGNRDEVAPLAPLDPRNDEIGQVAAAFELAQQTALDAAAAEAASRAGFNAVFLNIAHRSQGIVHRQLRTIDEAERAESDPEQLSRLFRLDHLATRERRNAENLIIMGGGRPGRQWRDPVALLEVVRSAVSEAVQYNRVTIGRMPAVAVVGGGVADVVHLLAELLDNATSFSPPESQIEVRGNLVGRGLIIEVEDQGLGIESSQREELNTLLSTPTDFGVLGLSEDSRLGLFVVARLAQRHDIRITLLESAFGGVRAVVLVPSALLDTRGVPAQTGADVAAPEPVEPGAEATATRSRRRPSPAHAVNSVGNGHGRLNRSDGGVAVADPDETLAPPTATDPTRPRLPRRRRQDALAPQLMQEPEPGPERPDDETADRLDADEAGERSRSVLGDLQRRTREARADQEEPDDGQ